MLNLLTTLCLSDIRNAFNEIRRHSVYEALSYSNPLLVATQFAWLSRPTLAALDNPGLSTPVPGS